MAGPQIFDWMDVRAVADWVKGSRRLRLLVLRKTQKAARIYGYTLPSPDPVTEREATCAGGVIVGYYTDSMDPAQLMFDIAAAMQ